MICDEIFEGLDTDSVKWVKNLFQQRKQENLSTLFTTHITEHITDITEKKLHTWKWKINCVSLTTYI